MSQEQGTIYVSYIISFCAALNTSNKWKSKENPEVDRLGKIHTKKSRAWNRKKQ